MRRFAMLTALAFALAGLSLAVSGQDLSDAEVQKIIESFAQKESEFLKARENYTYRQSVKLAELSPSGRETGKWEYKSDIVFGPRKERVERVTWAPVNTLKNILLTPEDEKDLRDVQPFVLTTENLDEYHIRYLGKQDVDELSCHMFAVKPKAMEKDKRYFAGVVWVETEDLQIVKTYGRGVGLLKKGGDNQFPKFETYRQQIDGHYWFPVFTIAETVLPFQSGPQPIKMVVKYEDYKVFGATTDIKYGGEADVPPEVESAPAPSAPKPR
jgi:outer membrane lipoprotein-sorting protein